MMFRPFAVLFLLFFMLKVGFAVTLNSTIGNFSKYPHSAIYEVHARKVLADGTRRMQSIYNRKQEIFLSITNKGRGYNVINQKKLKEEIDHDYRRLVFEVATNLSTIPLVQITDPILRRQIQRLSKLQLYGLTDTALEEARQLLKTMNNFITLRLVCHVHHQDECNIMVPMVPAITNHFVRTKSLEELQYYWTKWRAAINDRDQAKSTFIEYIRLIRVAATYNGHITPSRTWYLYYETENFQKELEDVIWEIMPLYKQLHAYLRYSARSSYDRIEIADDGAIPAPIIDQMIQQAWFQRTAFITPYPNVALPQVKQRLEEVLVTPLKISKKAAEFFESLGLNHMSDSFYDKYSRRMNDDEAGADCKSDVYYFPPNVAIRYCPKLDYKKLMQMHGYMAELQYNLYKKELPFGLDQEPCPGFGAAIAEAAVIASGSPRHLHRLHILYNESLTDEQAMNRLFRMGIHTLLSIPQYFVNEKFLVDVMDNRISSQEYNCAYWRLQNKYAGVVPPLIRDEKNFDPDFKFYRGLNPEKPNTMKLLAEVLGYQFYRSFCLASKQYLASNPNFPFHNCDFSQNEKAGALIKEIMQMGATKHWRDIMEIATGERKLSGKGVMEYFAPLFYWLKTKNKELGLEIGWDSETRCGNE